MKEEERALFIAERLFNGIWKANNFSIDVPIWDDPEGYSVLVFSKISNTDPDWNNLVKWLSSPEGINAIKHKMIERGYGFECGYRPHYNDKYPWFAFFGKCGGRTSLLPAAKIESEAIMLAAYESLKQRDDPS